MVIIRVMPQWLPPATFNPAISVFGKYYLPNKNGEVFIGVGARANPGKYAATLVEYGRGVSLSNDFTEIEVLEKNFGKPWFRNLPKRNPKIEAQRRIEQEIKSKAYSQADPVAVYIDGKFVFPLDDIHINDDFGTPRIYATYNKKTGKWIPISGISPILHGGVDLKARTDTPVKVINSGRVLLAYDFPIKGTEGKMVVVDHGSGILSFYLHLSRFKVTVGNKVAKGDIIALSGATPKGTPQHLHFIVRVNGVNVDPLKFIETINKYLN